MRHAIVIENAGWSNSAYVPDLPGPVATGASVTDVEPAGYLPYLFFKWKNWLLEGAIFDNTHQAAPSRTAMKRDLR